MFHLVEPAAPVGAEALWAPLTDTHTAVPWGRPAPPGGVVFSLRAPAQPVGGPILDFLRRPVGALPTAPPIDREEAASRAALAAQLADMHLLPSDERRQVDAQDAARLVLILHLANPYMQNALYRSHIGTPDQLVALRAARPDLLAWASSSGYGAPMLTPDFWAAWGDAVTLRDWNINETTRTVVLVRDHASLAPRADRTPVDTRDFVTFLQGVRQLLTVDYRREAPCAHDHLVRRHALLLYAIHCCLLRKNGRAVLAHARFDWMGNGRDALWAWMVRHDAHLEMARRDDADYVERVLPVQASWDSLLRMATIDLPVAYAVCDPQLPPRPDLADEDEDDGEEGDDEEAPAPPPRGEEPGATDLPSVPAREGDLEEGEAVEPAAGRIGCAYHRATERRDGFCPAACVAARLGAAIATGPLHVHVNGSAALRGTGPATPPRKAVQAMLVGALAGAGRPRARAALLGAQTAPIRAPASATEWADLSHAVDHVPASTPLPEDVDALATLGGWRAEPAAQRLARYIVANGAGGCRDQAWRQRGWPMDTAVSARLDVWLRDNPTVPLRTLQAVAHMLQ